ncbi:DUF2087 domain-containing protein [Virgisporangium aurantiacum]|uniref:DUF2087 domain-containing protein n=1 Tax=Virgisporangium aurantiacum TaxID=175570 RepID=A0A8J3Z171_9ACTN|nr:DUF2087 domain-containing protein [Virgisporangium aurantiacum]GIJ53445.1 hypothetical protein Vau01_009610 [Virgisporangium aurantiacum]
MRPDVLCGQLAEPDRLRVFAAVVLGAATPADVVNATGLPVRTVMAALRRLEQGGLVGAAGDALVAEVSAFKDAVREHGTPAAPAEPMDPDRQRDAVLRTFIVDGRIPHLPSAWAKRRVVLEHIVLAFEPGVKYPEKDVNAILRAWHDDHAALRRYLVDESLLDRADGEYWRSGGYVEVE